MYNYYFSNFGRSLVPDDLCKDTAPRHPRFWRRRFLKVFYHIWVWRPSWSTDHDHFSILSFPQLKEAPYEILAKLVQRLQKRSRLKMLTDGRTDEGRKVITIAHPEHSSGELKILHVSQSYYLNINYCHTIIQKCVRSLQLTLTFKIGSLVLQAIQ